MKNFILPIIAFSVGLISLYVDAKDKKKKWIFLFCLIITVSATIVFNFLDSQKSIAALTESKKKEESLTQILLNITTNTNQIPDLIKLLMKFGYTAENAEKATPEKVNKVINANSLFNESLSKISLKSTAQIKIEYFPKDVDGNIVNSILRNAGFDLVKGIPMNNLKTNAIWAGASVSVDEIKFVALVLIRAGVDLVTIERFKNGKGNKSRLIQIGADPANLGKSPLQLSSITNLKL